MENQEHQNDFSPLYKHLIEDISIQHRTSIQHPFSFYTSYSSSEEISINTSDFNSSMTLQKNMLEMVNHAYDCFLLEISLLKDKRGEYLNPIIDFLFDQYELSQNNNVILANSIRHVFYKICESQFNIYLKNSNRYKLSKWHTLKEPIKSFVSKIVYEDKWLEMRVFYPMKMLKIFKPIDSYRFLSKDTTYKTFKALFEGKYIENKIDWVDNKSSLIYFIKLLIKEKIIKHPKNKHWEIVSEFFLIKGEPIAQSELLNQKETKDKIKRHVIDLMIKRLKKYQRS